MEGFIYRISGPVVIAKGLDNPNMYDVVRVGKEELIGEIIKLEKGMATVQVYEDTSGLRPGDVVTSTGTQLSVMLAPGLVGSIYDGIQRPLDKIRAESGDFIARGINVESVDTKKKWQLKPVLEKGAKVNPGDIIAEVEETSMIVHRVLVPLGISGTISSISAGSYTIEEPFASVKLDSGKEAKIAMLQRWPVRMPRPVKDKLSMELPLITGQRVIDTMFPIAKGGTAAVPGPFGSGKTVIQHQLAKWSDADLIVYVGCGERGNEMTEILSTFPELNDPKTGKPLMDRTILIANTSNMPVAAREASIYTAITIAEYYRDMGYDVALMADSTSRWAEALREISGRLEEMPGEEGYPAYLGRKVAEFYERAGRVHVLNGSIASITAIGAVSPPGGDISEPVSQNTLRVTRVFWALDASLANARHFPSINWLNSYSLYAEDLAKWYETNISPEWADLYKNAMATLQKEAEINEIVQLVGYDALPEQDKVVLDTAKSLREDFLQQNAFDEIDTYSSMKKQYLMLKSIIKVGNEEALAVSRGVSSERMSKLEVRQKIAKMKFIPEQQIEQYSLEVAKLAEEMRNIQVSEE